MKTSSLILLSIALVLVAAAMVNGCKSTLSLVDETLLVKEKTEDGENIYIHDGTGEKLPASEVAKLPAEEQEKFSQSYTGPKSRETLNQEGWNMYGIGGVSLAALLSIAAPAVWFFRKKKFQKKKAS